MYVRAITTDLNSPRIVDLCAMINTVPVESRESWPPILGLFKSVVIALTYMRRNRVQCELAETYGVSQSTISRAITVLTPLFGKALQKYVPTADELEPPDAVRRGRDTAPVLVMGLSP